MDIAKIFRSDNLLKLANELEGKYIGIALIPDSNSALLNSVPPKFGVKVGKTKSPGTVFGTNKLLPEEILKITSKIEYSDLPDDEHIIRSPKELLSGEKGTCYDVVELERILFKGYKLKTFFAYAGLPVNDNRTHTFLVFEDGGKWYWFESTWVTNRGVHGPFKNIKLVVAMVRKQLEKDWKQKCDVIEYGPIDYSGMTLNNYGEEIVKKFMHQTL